MKEPGKVITFYSYKGGTGRTMALANAGVMLARQGAGKILMIDWDLEAPGLHSFFPEVADGSPDSRSMGGVLELFEEVELISRDSDRDRTVHDMWGDVGVTDCILETGEPSLHLMKAGRFDKHYGTRVNGFRWEQLFERSPALFKAFADTLAARYDYVLIDSRTGLTDSSGVCTTLLPERLVVVFTPNRQSLTGVVDLVRRATTYRSNSSDLRPLLVFPLASRVEMSEEELRREWRHGQGSTTGYQPQFERLFEEVYDLSACHLEHYFDEVQIQHATRYAYGERIAVRDERSDRLSLSRSYERFTRALLEANGPWTFEREPKPRADEADRAERILERVKHAQLLHARLAGSARRRQSVVRAIQSIAALIAFFATASVWIDYPSNDVAELTTAVLPTFAVGAAVLAGLEYLRRELAFGNHYVAHARTANALGRERSFFEAGAGPYVDADDPVVLLTERYENILMDAENALLYPRGRPSGAFDRLPGRSSRRETSD